jgi:hypothetical protein
VLPQPFHVHLSAARNNWESWETVLGKDHPSTLASMNNPADVLNRQGKYEQAEDYPHWSSCFRRRNPTLLPNKGHFNLGVFGWIFNIVTVGWTLLALVVYDLPLYLPVTGSNMSKPSPPLTGFLFLRYTLLTVSRLYLRRDWRASSLWRHQLVLVYTIKISGSSTLS